MMRRRSPSSLASVGHLTRPLHLRPCEPDSIELRLELPHTLKRDVLLVADLVKVGREAVYEAGKAFYAAFEVSYGIGGTRPACVPRRHAAHSIRLEPKELPERGRAKTGTSFHCFALPWASRRGGGGISE
jgi:hypothetical protein